MHFASTKHLDEYTRINATKIDMLFCARIGSKLSYCYIFIHLGRCSITSSHPDASDLNQHGTKK